MSRADEGGGSGPAALRFRILGVLEVRVNDEPVVIGSAKQRALLAVLVLSPRQVVSADAIADALWGGSPPATAGSTLNSLVFRLRKALGGASAALRTSGPGYVLDVDPEHIDAVRFDRWSAAGRGARADGDSAGAVSRFRQALSLWRGPALAGLAEEPFAQAEAARLDESRLMVLEELAESELAAGQPEAALDLMRPHTAAQPLRERGWGVLMLAEYRLGRQADALRTYQRARRSMVEELGVEPLPWLRRLEDQILQQAPALDDRSGGRPWDGAGEGAAGGQAGMPPLAPPAGGAGDPRAGLPVPITPFTGREEELEHVRHLIGRSRLVTLLGVGGVGKTRLATEVGGQALDLYPDGVWMVDLVAIAEPALVVTRVVAALGLHLDATSTPLLEARLCDHLQERRMLLILDNCEHVLPGVTPLARRLLGHCPAVSVLATSQAVLGLAGEVTWPVPPLGLPPEDSRVAADLAGSDAATLFCERAARAQTGFALSDTDAAAVARICRRLEGIPLALELAAARMRALSAEQIADRLDDRFRLLRATPGEDARHQTLRATMEWSYRLLTGPEQRVLLRLSEFPGSFELSAAETVVALDQDGDDGADIVFRLVDRSLVTVDTGASPGRAARYRLLETVRHYAAEALAEEGDTAAAEARHTAFFAGLCRDQLGRPYWWEGADWLRRVAEEEDNLRAALARSLELGDQVTALTLAAALWEYWFWAGRPEGSMWLERALAGPRGPALVVRAEAMCGLAIFLTFGDSLDRARATVLLEEAAAMVELLEDRETSARAAYLRGQLAAAQGDVDEARRSLTEAQILFDAGGSPGAGWCEHELGWVAVAAGDDVEALRRFERAASLADRAEMLAPHALSSVATVLAQSGEAERARATAEEAVTRARAIPARLVEVMTLVRAAETHLVLGDEAGARRLTIELLALQRRVGSGAWVAEALDLASMLLASHDAPGAAGLLGAATSLRQVRDERRPGSVAERVGAAREVVTRKLGPAAAALEAAGATRSAAVAVNDALALLEGLDRTP